MTFKSSAMSYRARQNNYKIKSFYVVVLVFLFFTICYDFHGIIKLSFNATVAVKFISADWYQHHSQISRSSVHRWKLISGLGRGQSHSGPLGNSSEICREIEIGRDQKYHKDNQTKHPTTSSLQTLLSSPQSPIWSKGKRVHRMGCWHDNSA